MDFIETVRLVYQGFLAGIFIALSCSMFGVYLLMRRLSMLGAGISHSAFGGIALSFLLELEPMIFTLVYTAVVSFFIQFLMERKNLPSDTILSLFFSFGTAIAVIILSATDNLGEGIYSYLFGSILTVSNQELYLSLLVFLLSLSIFKLKYNQLFLLLFNEEIAKLKGIKTSFINYLFTLLAGVNIVLSIKVAGLLLSASFVALPSMTALLVAGSFLQTFLFSALFAVLSVVLGIIVSLIYNLPPSGAIVIIITFFFILSSAIYMVKTRKGF